VGDEKDDGADVPAGEGAATADEVVVVVVDCCGRGDADPGDGDGDGADDIAHCLRLL